MKMDVSFAETLSGVDTMKRPSEASSHTDDLTGMSSDSTSQELTHDWLALLIACRHRSFDLPTIVPLDMNC